MKPKQIDWNLDKLYEHLKPARQTALEYKQAFDDQNWVKHLKTVNRHRKLVRQYCFRLGLYRQGLMHDLSKYSPVEFRVGAKYFQGFQSPNNAERLDKGYSSSWLHHKGRNKHHLEYWIDYSLGGEYPLEGMEIPVEYVAEMFCDRVAASRIYLGDKYTNHAAWDYFHMSLGHMIVHPNTQKLLERMLKKLADEGEDAAFTYIRKEILKK